MLNDRDLPASVHAEFTEGFDTADLKEAKACPLIHLMASRSTNLHRSITPTRYHSGGGIVCIRHIMRRRSSSLGRRLFVPVDALARTNVRSWR